MTIPKRLYVTGVVKQYYSNEILYYYVMTDALLNSQMVTADVLYDAYKQMESSYVISDSDTNIRAMLRHTANGDIKSIQLKDWNPKRSGRAKAYYSEYTGDLVREYFAIVTDYNTSNGTVQMLLDTPSGLKLETGIVGEIASRYGFDKLTDFIMYNGYIKDTQGDIIVNVYNTETKEYDTLAFVIAYEEDIKKALKDWDITIQGVSQAGIEIGEFSPKKRVTYAELPEGISYIGSYAGGLKELKLPSSLKSVGAGCFSNKSDINSIKFSRGLQTIPYRCFYNSNIKTVEFSGTERKIARQAFCESQLSGRLMTTAEKIGDEAFRLTNLQILYLYGTQDHRQLQIGRRAFEYNKKLKRVVIKDSDAVYIDREAFAGNSKLSELVFPQYCKRIVIDKSAFDKCRNIKTIKLNRNTELYFADIRNNKVENAIKSHIHGREFDRCFGSGVHVDLY